MNLLLEREEVVTFSAPSFLIKVMSGMVMCPDVSYERAFPILCMSKSCIDPAAFLLVRDFCSINHVLEGLKFKYLISDVS